jgi:hypothetical protein
LIVYPGVGYIYCSRALGAVYYRRLAGCHLVSFLRSLLLLPAYKKVIVRLGASGITAKMKGLNLERQPERMMVFSQDCGNGLNDAVWRH